MHIELVTAFTTAAGASGAAAAAVTGDSLTVKNGMGKSMILSAWCQSQADGWMQIIKPSGHDTTRGFRQVVDGANIMNLFAAGMMLEVEAQELLSLTLAGSATAGDVEQIMLQMYYDNLPGVQGRFIDFAELMQRAEMLKLNTIQATLTGAAAGYTGSQLITAGSNLLQANRDYAVLGITTNIPCGAVYLSGADTAYQKVAVPGGVSEADYGRDWFCSQSRAFQMPLIPVINSGNKESTYLGFVQNENNISPQVSVCLALLAR